MYVYSGGMIWCHIGFWKEGYRHGYGKSVYPSGEVSEGLFDMAGYDWEKAKKDYEITGYDPKSDPITKQIDFFKYGHKKTYEDKQDLV